MQPAPTRDASTAPAEDASTGHADSESGTVSTCGTTECSNCVDDDNDGLVDSADTECTGALDNSEATFATGITGDNSDACKQDCFFDGNSGSGDDGCVWDLRCDPASPGAHAESTCSYDETSNNCPETQSQHCVDYCGQYAPNGCDCFGCCTVVAGGVTRDVMLSPTCSADTLDDPNLCPSCTKVASCDNPCEPCEYCLGRPPDPSCAAEAGAPDAPPAAQCPPLQTACAPGDVNTCPAGYYCLTGCCTKFEDNCDGGSSSRRWCSGTFAPCFEAHLSCDCNLCSLGITLVGPCEEQTVTFSCLGPDGNIVEETLDIPGCSPENPFYPLCGVVNTSPMCVTAQAITPGSTQLDPVEPTVTIGCATCRFFEDE